LRDEISSIAETIVSASIQVWREMTGIRMAQTFCAAKFIGNRLLHWHPTAKPTIFDVWCGDAS
jgi:hypothetical protein